MDKQILFVPKQNAKYFLNQKKQNQAFKLDEIGLLRYYEGHRCGYGIMAIMSAFQAEYAGSIPATRSGRENPINIQLIRHYLPYPTNRTGMESLTCSAEVENQKVLHE